MTIHIVRGAEAHSLLQDCDFQADWLRLHEQCPRATAFQHPDYGSVWYRVYRRCFEPVLVFSRAADGAIDGLLALAVSFRDGGLMVAGGRQAEYQTWICRPGSGRDFARQAVRLLQHHFPRAVLTFHYLPPGTPLDWLAAADAASTVACYRRPLVRFDREQGDESSLKKKKTRYRLKQLEKLGRLEFKRIRDPREFADVLDSIIQYYDFRQEAAHGAAPFRSDDLKKELILARMRNPATCPHATVLTIGGRIASAHLGVCSDKEVHLGLLAYNPFFAKHSPGKFHLLFLAEMLKEEGCEQLDLTPGDDPYKEHFANDADEVHTLTLFLSPAQRSKAVVHERVLDAVKTGMRTCRIEPARLKALVGRFTSGHPVRTPLNFLRGARQWIGGRRELRIYSFEAARALDFEESGPIKRDALEDLLDYQAVESGQSRQGFLSTALTRLEDGLHVFTHAQSGCLLHFGWLAERQDTVVSGAAKQGFQLPANSACLFDFYTVPGARNRGLFTRSLQKMLHDAARIPGTEKIFISVPADNRPGRGVIEKVGFVHECSLFEEVQFGRARRWTRVP